METEHASITRQLYIDASPTVVYEVLTSPQHIRAWWNADTDLIPAAGAESTLNWIDAAGTVGKSVPFTVVEADAPRLFSFRWTHEEGESAGSANSLLVTFELIAEGAGTTVHFCETGYRERDWDVARATSYYVDHQQGWDHLLPRVAELAGQLATAR